MDDSDRSHPPTCNECKSALGPGLSFGPQPIANHLLDTNNELVDVYPLEVTICRVCGLVQLVSPIDSSMFYENYATPSSWKREPHTERLLDELRRVLPVTHKILDVGCNDGTFLALLRGAGWQQLQGLEPTKNTAAECRRRGFDVVHDSLTSEFAKGLANEDGQSDCVILRQVLEHIADLADFGLALATLVKPGGLLVIEVPDGSLHLRARDYSIWEEHVNYFTSDTLALFLDNAGFDIETAYDSLFSGTCLTVLARRRQSETPDFSGFRHDKEITDRACHAFDKWASEFREFRAHIQREIQTAAALGPVVLYGVGCRSTNFINVMGVAGHLSAAIDAQPGKQGRFIPGAMIEILGSGEYEKLFRKPATVLLGVNAENEEKVISATHFPVTQWWSVLPPSPRLVPGWNSEL